MKKIDISKSITGYSVEMFVVGIQAREVFEKVLKKVQNLISKK